jgi:hypothetical protein
MLCSASNSDTLASGNGGSRRNRCFSSSKEWLRSATYGPYYRVRADGFNASFLPNPDEVLDEVCNVDAEAHLPDGSRWSATIFTVAEVGRLMKQWEETPHAQEQLHRHAGQPETQRLLRTAEYQVMIPSPLLNRRSSAEKRGLRHERPSILAVERRRREIAM